MRHPRSTSWSSTLDRMQQADKADGFSEIEALKALDDLFRRAASANKAQKDIKVDVRRCARNVPDGPKGRCGLALLAAERDFCTFHANPTRFKAAGVAEDEVYDASPLMKQHLAP